MTDRTLIDQIKDAFTVADAWHALALPGTPARCCRIPWAEKDTAALLQRVCRTGGAGSIIAMARAAMCWTL
jgi:hypothetical protein